MSNYSSIGETVNLSDAARLLAVDRLVKGALQGVNARYQALLAADSTYQAFLAEADRGRANAGKYRQMAKTLGQKAEKYAKRLDEGMNDAIDEKERTSALMESQFYDGLAEAEEEKIFPSPELNAKLKKLRENAMNDVASQLGYNTWKKVEAEASAIEGEIMPDIYQGLNNAARRVAEERAAEERRAVIETNKPYLDGVRTSAEELLRSLFGEYVYVSDPQVIHVDGRLEHRIPATIYTDNPETTIAALQKELMTPEGTLTLVSAETIPLNDGTRTFIVEAKYRGSKHLH